MSKKIIALSASALFAAFGVGAGFNAAQSSAPVHAVPSYTATMTPSTPATPSASASASPVTSTPGEVEAAQTPVGEPVMPEQPKPEPKPTWGYMHYPNWLHPVVVQTCVRDQVSIEECTARSEAYAIELQRKAIERTSKAAPASPAPTATKPVGE